MEFYILLFIVVSLVSFSGFFVIDKQNQKFILVIIGIIFMFLSGMRWNNPDWQIYYPFWTENITYDDFMNSYIAVDYGYAFINFIVKQFSDEYTVLLSVLAVIIIGIKTRFILAFSLCPLFTLLYWFGTYLGDIFFIRQTLAVSLTMVAYYFIVKKQFIPFLLITIIASTIQISVVFFIFAYYVYHKKIPVYMWGVLLVMSLTIGLFVNPTMMLSIASFLNVIPMDLERVINKALVYADEESGSLFLSYLRRIICLPLEFWAITKMVRLDERFRGNVNLIALGTCMFFCFANISTTLAGRTSTPFHIYEIIVIPEMLLLINSVYYRMLGWCALLLLSMMKYINEINAYHDLYIPYINVLFE